MFVVIDGIDGAGKGTQVALVAEELRKKGKTVKLLDYPRYSEVSSFAVKKYLNGEYGKNVSPKLASIFYALDRYDDSFNFREDLQKYDYVLSNRYVSASMIHQAAKVEDREGKRQYIKWLKDLEYNIFGIPKPDKVVFLDISLENALLLIEKKDKREYIKSGKNVDIHEADKEYLHNSIKTAHFTLSLEEDWFKISCEENGKLLPKEEITEKILKFIL